MAKPSGGYFERDRLNDKFIRPDGWVRIWGGKSDIKGFHFKAGSNRPIGIKTPALGLTAKSADIVSYHSAQMGQCPIFRPPDRLVNEVQMRL